LFLIGVSLSICNFCCSYGIGGPSGSVVYFNGLFEYPFCFVRIGSYSCILLVDLNHSSFIIIIESLLEFSTLYYLQLSSGLLDISWLLYSSVWCILSSVAPWLLFSIVPDLIFLIICLIFSIISGCNS